jgi:PAS domain S-box-containing protein
MSEASPTADELLAQLAALGQRVTDLEVANAELRQRAGLLEEIYQAYSDLLFRLAPDGTIREYKASISVGLYKPPDEFLGRRMQDVLTPEAGAIFDRGIQRLLAGETHVSIAYELPMATEWRSFEGSLTLLSSQDILVLIRDVTERQQTQEALAGEQHLLRTLLESVPDGIYFKDAESRFIRINRAVAERFGLTDPAQAVGKTDADFFTPAFAQETRRDELKVMKTGKPLLGKEEKESWPDGRESWAMTTTMPLRGPSGRVIGTIGISRDVTAQKRAEEALRESEARLRMALGAARMGTWDWDLRTGRVTRSADYEALFGMPPGSLRGTFDEFVKRTHPDDRAALSQALERCKTELAPYAHEYRVVWPDGSIHWLAARGRCYRDAAGLPVRMLGVTTDVTERKQLEEQLVQAQKMEAVGRLAGGIAHDFNNMLTGIQGYSELLLTDLPPGDPNRELVIELQKGADRAAQLTSQLLAFGRRQRLDPQRRDLNAVLNELGPALRHLVLPGVFVEIVPYPKPLWYRVDLGQMQQVLVNLVMNARDAMPQGGQLRIVADQVLLEPDQARRGGPPPGDYVLLSLADTGKGMTAEVRAHLFEPFFTTKDVGQGSGLGLSSTYGIVTQSGGFIEVESEPGRGTTFRIYFPRLPAEEGTDTMGDI